jgi:hypothetical protein
MPSPTPTEDTSIADFLARRGVSDSTVRQLGLVADRTGYGGFSRVIAFDDAQGLASVMVTFCDEIAAGEKTWTQSVAEDVATGAPRADAEEMNRYLRQTFCPAVV